MFERDGYMSGVPCWIDTAQPDPNAAKAFYEDLFGWAFEDRMPPGSGGHYYMATLRGLEVAAIGFDDQLVRLHHHRDRAKRVMPLEDLDGAAHHARHHLWLQIGV